MKSNLIYWGLHPEKYLPANHYLVHGIFGMSQDSRTIEFSGGQSVVFFVKNINVLGTTIEISPNQHFMNTVKTFLLPFTTYVFQWSIFCEEPKNWSFDASSISDATSISIQIYSTWVRGMMPNPYRPKNIKMDGKSIMENNIKLMESLKRGKK